MIHRERPPTIPAIPRVIRNDGTRSLVVSRPLASPTTRPTAQAGRHGDERVRVAEQDRGDHRAEGDDLTDRQVDLAGRERERHPEGHDRDERRLAQDVQLVLDGEEPAVPERDGEEHEDQDEAEVDDRAARQSPRDAQPPLPPARSAVFVAAHRSPLILPKRRARGRRRVRARCGRFGREPSGRLLAQRLGDLGRRLPGGTLPARPAPGCPWFTARAGTTMNGGTVTPQSLRTAAFTVFAPSS